MDNRQRAVLDQAFFDALLMANLVIRPSGIPAEVADAIYKKYFPMADKGVVIQVFKNIIGQSWRRGNAKIADVTIEMSSADPIICPPPGSGKLYFMYTDGESTINVCPDFWLYIGNWNRWCEDLGPITSHIMEIPGSSILHEFT